jgi:hypothetical protein
LIADRVKKYDFSNGKRKGGEKTEEKPDVRLGFEIIPNISYRCHKIDFIIH